MTTKKKRFRAFDPDPDRPERCCDMPHCREPAGYKAPKSPTKLNEYYWFCFDHIKEYNKNWDFCKGMTPAQIEQQLRSASVWDKPSWKLGQLGKADLLQEQFFKDSLGIFSKHSGFNTRKHSQPTPKSAPTELKDSLKILGLTWPISLQDLKKRYTSLARQYHPDSNGGDSQSEEQFKTINAAYSQVRTHLINSVEI
ncbi:J domain-containing protein [Commensalibacter oyaizuii]|uniref:J domain-containing protein n=1 Tax=Commensalibacter oyaizuii TaxID=3043873 RepID=A0ABT6Q138_9PROT|nr:J domain-containing protein [Commensalibacter sp. TBRC 16381]MDI2090831.1 J domain-containing protein [Commensalibacter sp. TBRC 16381]